MSDLGQLIFTGLNGINLNEEEKKFIQNENIGGVILFKKNFESPGQLAELINSIQALRQERPLFIATDHEGGRVIRFKNGFTHFPSSMELSKSSSPKKIFEVYQIMAHELKACGVNVNLAPVCDILTNKDSDCIGDRAFGIDEETVSKYISSAIRGLQTNGIISCAKHFPGHGATSKDSHLDLPIIKTPLELLQKRELRPFSKAIKSRVEFVMMAHLVVDCIDNEQPCTLSKKAHNYLRNELKFEKIIISDDMQMKAITDHFGQEEAAVKAILAGTDIIEYRDFLPAQTAYEALKKAVKDKRLKAEELSKKYQRIATLKDEYLKEYKPVYIPSIEKAMNFAEHQVFLKDLLSKINSEKTA